MRMEDIEKINEELPFDVVDDMAVYMRNDPVFYRKSFFPAVMRMKSCYDSGKKFNAIKEFGPMIDQAANSYCKKFKIERRPVDLLDDEERKDLIRKIYEEELKNIREGVYE